MSPPAGHLANVLQEANVPIISDAVCNAPDYYDSQITTSMFCAGYEKGGIDACQVSLGRTRTPSPQMSSVRPPR